MRIIKAYKFRLYPNIDQKILINKTIECTRFIYNYMLEKKIKNSKLSRLDLNNLILLARCYQKLRNARKKLTEKIVSKVTEYNDIIVCEKLKVKET